MLVCVCVGGGGGGGPMCACVYALKIVSADTILRFIKTLTVLNFFF